MEGWVRGTQEASRHPNIPMYLAVTKHTTGFFSVEMECCDRYGLDSCYKKIKPDKRLIMAMSVCKQLCMALLYMEEVQGQTHPCICPSKVLVRQDGCVKLDGFYGYTPTEKELEWATGVKPKKTRHVDPTMEPNVVGQRGVAGPAREPGMAEPRFALGRILLSILIGTKDKDELDKAMDFNEGERSLIIPHEAFRGMVYSLLHQEEEQRPHPCLLLAMMSFYYDEIAWESKPDELGLRILEHIEKASSDSLKAIAQLYVDDAKKHRAERIGSLRRSEIDKPRRELYKKRQTGAWKACEQSFE
jgi:hypothetical protein